MSTRLTDRRIAGLLVSLLLAIGVVAAPAQLTTGADAAQTHAQTHA
ncbi:MAG: hypothetical protein QOC68_406 [Solirubrobacteraceae bacterium]|jgi:hypothetical protein|nr:hypothetical protein [Solirubrobacteraceae bacterium]